MKRISFDEALKLPEGTRVKITDRYGSCWEETTGGKFYEYMDCIGFIEKSGLMNLFSREDLLVIVVLDEYVDIQNTGCNHPRIKKVPIGIGPSSEIVWVCCDCGEEII